MDRKMVNSVTNFLGVGLDLHTCTESRTGYCMTADVGKTHLYRSTHQLIICSHSG
jgi:hypothetical protein